MLPMARITKTTNTVTREQRKTDTKQQLCKDSKQTKTAKIKSKPRDEGGEREPNSDTRRNTRSTGTINAAAT